MLKLKKGVLRRLHWGVAGCGKFTETAFLPTLAMIPRNKLVSVYSSDVKRAQYIREKFGAKNAFNNYKEFLKSDFDALYIASVNSDHHWQVIEAAKAGKHILCEKPLAMNSPEAEEMVKICEEQNVLLSVNYVQRFHPLVIKAKEIIDKEMIGKLVSININFNIDYAPDDNFRFKKNLSGGGALRDLGTHIIDLMRYFGGEIKSIDGVIDNVIYKSEVDDFAAAILSFKKSGYGYFNVSYNNKKAFNRIEIVGYKGALSIENLIGVKFGSTKLTILIDGEAKKAFRKRGNKFYYLLKSIQKSFLKNEQPLVTGNDGLINMRLMEELERKCL